MKALGIGFFGNYWVDYDFLEDEVNLTELRFLSEEQLKIAKKIIIAEIESKTYELKLFRFKVTNIEPRLNLISWSVSDKGQDTDELRKKYTKIFEDTFTIDILNSIVEKSIRYCRM